jgi:DMSO/TMAO reductase YedYZ molybdopterin-dependent catalytic subunit
MPITPRFFGERGRRRAASLGIDPDRLPPGQSPTVKWPVLSVGATPRVDRDRWILSIDGAVEESGGYTTNLPLADVLAHPAFIAHEADGEPLEADHGGPARLLVPHLYLWKSAKWINRLEILEADELGFWERNGYHHRGDPWREERYSDVEFVVRALRRDARQRGTR